MELVGEVLSLEKTERGTIYLDFACSNKEIFKGILVPPALQNLPAGLLRIKLHRPFLEKEGRLAEEPVLVHWEMVDT